jgi:hypothetical protein
MPSESELRTASDTFLAQLERLHALENEKRLLTPGSERMIALAAEIEAIAGEVLGVAGVQHRRAEEAAHVPGLRPIEAIPPRDAYQVLADWRAAERRLYESAPASVEEALAQADIDRLRDEYRRTFEQRLERA